MKMKLCASVPSDDDAALCRRIGEAAREPRWRKVLAAAAGSAS